MAPGEQLPAELRRLDKVCREVQELLGQLPPETATLLVVSWMGLDRAEDMLKALTGRQ